VLRPVVLIILTRGLARSRAVTAGELKSPEQLASDYLQALCKHLEYHLEQKLGESVMRTTAMEICLTVPAIWSEIAKEKTLKACSDTGLNISASGIHLVTEPVSKKLMSCQNDLLLIPFEGGGCNPCAQWSRTSSLENWRQLRSLRRWWRNSRLDLLHHYPAQTNSPS